MNQYQIFLLSAYILGSIPFGLALCFIFGYGDIRKIGSGNIGATNVLRTGNKLLALATLILDMGKGAIAVLITLNITQNPTLATWAGVVTVIGHNFPIWLKFKGGKGIATTLGTIIAINPLIGLITIILWIITAKVTKYSSVAGMTALISAPITAYLITKNGLILPLSILASFAICKHVPNIKRLINGTEQKIKKNKAKK